MTPATPDRIPAALLTLLLPERPDQRMVLIVPHGTEFLPDLLLGLENARTANRIPKPPGPQLAEHGEVRWPMQGIWQEATDLLRTWHGILPEGAEWKPIATVHFSDGNYLRQEFLLSREPLGGPPEDVRRYIRRLILMYQGEAEAFPVYMGEKQVREFTAMYSHLREWARQMLEKYDI